MKITKGTGWEVNSNHELKNGWVHVLPSAQANPYPLIKNEINIRIFTKNPVPIDTIDFHNVGLKFINIVKFVSI